MRTNSRDVIKKKKFIYSLYFANNIHAHRRFYVNVCRFYDFVFLLILSRASKDPKRRKRTTSHAYILRNKVLSDGFGLIKQYCRSNQSVQDFWEIFFVILTARNV